MDPPQLGESSRSPRHHVNGDTPNTADVDDTPIDIKMSKLILPKWNVPTNKHVHASHDLISLLHLDTLYNACVRPFADAIGPEEVQGHMVDGDMGEDAEGGGGKKRVKGKRRKLEKGYQHLIDDCIDPTPMGEKKDNVAILPLIGDMSFPPTGPAPDLYTDALQSLPKGLFENARLEVGQKQDGYMNGNKLGVAEAEERRRKKRARQTQSIASELPSPAPPSMNTTTEPSTPHLPIAPPSHLPSRPLFPVNTTRRSGSTSGPIRPPRGGPYVSPRSGTPARPGYAGPAGYTGQGSGSGGGNKRPADGLVVPPAQKRSKQGLASRSTSPMPPSQGRPGMGKIPRSRTEDV